MTQYVINIGALPNDGTGDPLRTAFNEVNLNFDQVFAAGPVLSNIQIANNTILVTNTNGNLVLATNGIGKIQAAADIVPSVNLARNLGSSTQKWNTIYSQYITISGDATVAGNLSVAGNIIQVGNIVTDALTIQLANTASTANAANGSGITVGANDNIATILYSSTSNAWTTNIGVSAVGNISAPYFIGNGSQLTGVTASGVAASGLTGNTLSSNVLFSSLTSVGTLANLSVSGNVTGGNILTGGLVSATGNITGNYFIGNGSLLTGLPEGYSNANVATFLAGFGSNSISTTGNITSGNLRVNSTANIDVLNVNSSGNTWTISGNVLTAPSNAIWQSDPATLDEYINSALDGYINMTSLYANANIASQLHLEHGLAQIITQDGSQYIWEFDSTGNLTLPSGGAIYSQGFTPSGSPGNTIILNPHGSGSITNQKLMIYPTAADGDHLHLATGNLYETELFLGNDNFYIKLSNTGNAVVNTNDDNGNTAQWQFGSDGNLTLPQGMVISGNVNFLGTDTALLTPADNTPLSLFSSGANGTITSFWTDDVGNLMTSNIAAIYTPLQGTQTVRIVTGSNSGNLAIYDFDPDGMFTAGAVCATGNVYAGNVSASGNVTGAYVLGNGSGLTSLPAPTVSQDITSNGAMSIMLYDGNIKYNNYATVEPVSGNIAAGNISTTGNVTGNNLIATGNIVLTGSLVGSGASPAPSLSGFSSVSAANLSASGNITGGNILTSGLISATGNVTGNYFVGNGNQLTDVNAVTVDVTDTNGLTTIYYPTFVENRTTAQIARADVDLTYRTDDNLLTVGNVSVTGNVTGNTAGFAIGYRDIPQVSFTGDATIATTDAGKHYYSTLSTGNVLTIANNASQGFQVGAAITVVNQGTGNITVAQGSGVTLYLAGNVTAGNRIVATFGMATIIKVATDTWFINGTGVS
jgi:hypothetical protein